MERPDGNATTWRLLLALGLSLGIVFFLLWGGGSLGFFLTVLTAEIVFLAWIRLPFGDHAITAQPADAGASAGIPATGAASAGTAGLHLPGRTVPVWLEIALAAVIVALAFCFVRYDNPILRVLNCLVLMVLLPVQYLLAARVFEQDWDRPDFWLEVFFSWFARPWLCLKAVGRSVSFLLRKRGNAETTGQPHAVHPFGRILFGIALAVPVLLISGVLLAAAEPLFESVFSRVAEILSNLSLGDLPWQIFVALLLLPPIFSFLHSGRSRQRLLRMMGGAEPIHLQTENIRADKLVLNTFLTCINALYLVFAVIQVKYLTGAFSTLLPADMTYSEYARSGFFELAAVSTINLALVLLAIKSADRRGLSGIILRVESLLLIAGSLVQWASAMFRMQMYVGSYGLTLIRFLVTAFMILQLALFLLMLVKEWWPRLPLFKLGAAAVLASLLILNLVNCDGWIARYNVERYQKTGKIDTQYFRELSDDAVPAMLTIAADGTADSTAAGKAVAGLLVERYDNELKDYTYGRWQNLNISQGVAQRLIAERLTELRQASGLNPR